MACRSEEKAQEAIQDIKKQCKNKEKLGELIVFPLDLSSLKSVRNFAKEILQKEKRIDLLINNAGIMMCPFGRTEDGFEQQLGTNHLGHFLLTMLLLPKIIESAPARIVNVSSMANGSGFVIIYKKPFGFSFSVFSGIRNGFGGSQLGEKDIQPFESLSI